MKNYIKFFFVLYVLSVFYSCSVDIDGAPCSPELNNCPNGQYCTEEGVCKYGSKDVNIPVSDVSMVDIYKDVFNDIGKDIEDEDCCIIQEDIITDNKDINEDVVDVIEIEDIADAGDILDSGCIDECKEGQISCISDKSYYECVPNSQTGCYEWGKNEHFCNAPPENQCVDNNTLKIYDSNGSCISDHCEYKSKVISCLYGCENGVCKNCTPDCTNKQCGDDGCGGSCGSCGNNALCEQYKCKCYNGYDNCNKDWSDGCEIDLKNDVKNCGYCKNECKVNNGEAGCENKICIIVSCYFPYDDCDDLYTNGCETSLTTVEKCGDCGNNCNEKNWQNVAEYKCVSGFNKYFCQIKSCETNNDDCDDVATNGCEVDLMSDKENCGKCGKICDEGVMNVTNAFCNQGNCDYDKCKIGWEDENFSRADGCETYNYFPKTYGTSNSEEASSIIALNDGYLLVGNSNNAILIIRLDLNGNVIWSKSYSDNINSFFANAAILDSDANILRTYVIAGSMKSTTNSKDLIVFKIDDNGTILWKFIYQTINFEEATSLLRLNDGYVVVGTQSKGNDIDAIVLKLNTDGSFSWGNIYSMKSQSGEIAKENIYSIYRTNSVDFLVVGSTIIGSIASDVLLMYLDANGGLKKAFSLGGTNNDYGKSILPTIDGNYLITGFTNSSGKGLEDVLLLKFKITNDLINVLGGYTYGDKYSNLLINTISSGNKGFIFVGQTNTQSNSYDGFLMNVASDGNILWQMGYGGSNWDMFNTAAFTQFDSGYIALGRSISFTSNYDLWAVKTDSFGKVFGNCPSGIPYALSLEKLQFNPSISDYEMTVQYISDSLQVFNIYNSEVSINSQMQCSTP